MEKMIAFCGIICSECPGYIATQKDDDAERKKVADQWSKMFNVDIKPETINCDGCLSSTGRLIEFCSICDIRKCGLEKKVENCAHCEEYVCDKLNKWFEKVPDAKKTLDDIRGNLQK